MLAQWRLRRVLNRLAAIISGSDQADRADELLAVARSLAANPATASRRALALYEGAASLDRLALTRGGVAFAQPGRERDEMFEFARLKWTAYERALALWHKTKTQSPLAGITNRDPVQKLADYGGGNEVWRARGKFILRADVGSHVSRWRDDSISPEQAEQAVLGPDHFYHLVLAIQRALSKRGQNPNAGSTMPLPDPPPSRP